MSKFKKMVFLGWSEPNWATLLVMPLVPIYRLLSAVRSLSYRLGIVKQQRVEVPVIIVGNISVGGTGKTPLTATLIDILLSEGFKPGVISRGYGGKALDWPQVVKSDSNPHYIGDEAVLIAKREKCPVVVGPERVKAARKIIDEFGVDIIVSDDGLQHYALARDIEIAVVDAQRRHKNLHCLPAGPLRESTSRLKNVDMVMLHVNQDDSPKELLKRLGLPIDTDKVTTMSLKPEPLIQLVSQQVSQSKVSKQSEQSVKLNIQIPLPPARIHAVAGIGHPQRFFKLLARLGYDVVEQAFEDHHEFVAEDFYFGESSLCTEPIVMTEKDAVKCGVFAQDNFFYLPVSAQLNANAEQKFIKLIKSIKLGRDEC